MHMTVLNGPGEFSLTLKAGLALRIEAGRASLSFPAPAAGAVRLSLTVPGENTVVNISPGLITGRVPSNGRTAVEATLAPGQPVTVWWATHENAKPAAPKQIRFLSDVKTLISVREAGLAAAALASITVVQGDPAEFTVDVPAGYEVTGVTGPELASSDVQGGVLILRERSAAARTHQFLISMERAIEGSKAGVSFVSFRNTQRETGEALVEGEGAIELAAKESGGVQRMDLKEASPYLVSLAHAPLQSAFRYHRQPGQTPELALEWVRFPEGSVVRAVAQQAVVTTMVTSEGRSLTEVKLVLKNQAQPFLKVGLPPGASVVSADVGGEQVKPVEGPDGHRVPLLRAGFRPADSYTVSFVYMDSGAPFARKGGSEVALPKMDVPIALLNWEVFLPERYKVTDFGGDAIAERLMPVSVEEPPAGRQAWSPPTPPPSALPPTDRSDLNRSELLPGQLGGTVVDATGAGVTGARVTVSHPGTGAVFTAYADREGRWVVSNVPSGRVRIAAQSPGFRIYVMDNVAYDANRPARYRLALAVGETGESVTVQADSGAVSANRTDREPKKVPAPQQQETQASANVLNLQRRIAGVLPVAVEVPKAGTSFRFVRPLVVDEETKVTFRYKMK